MGAKTFYELPRTARMADNVLAFLGRLQTIYMYKTASLDLKLNVFMFPS